MAVVDASKYRRAGAGAADAGDLEDCGEDARKDRRAASVRFWEALRRRFPDVIGLGFYFSAVVIGCGGFHLVLVQAPETLALQILRPLFKGALVLFQLSWVGAVYHGPGRPPASAAEPDDGGLQTPDLLAGALNAGLSCRTPDRRFGVAGAPCGTCRAWKPVLAHHCKVCDRCSTWMDHHCNLLGQCVGFRNMRCFILWLLYGLAVMGLLVLLTAHRLWHDGRPRDIWSAALWAGWIVYLFMVLSIIAQAWRATSLQIAAGWPSKVLMIKFKGLLDDATEIETEALELKESVPPSLAEGVELREAQVALRAAAKNVQFQHQMLRGLTWGPFATKPKLAFEALFGGPVSWRWLVPLVPGGTGDPFKPVAHRERSCEAWIELAKALARGSAAIDAAMLVRQAKKVGPCSFAPPNIMLMEGG